MPEWPQPRIDGEAGLELARDSLLEIAEEVSHSGSWAWAPEEGGFIWSENLRRMWQIESVHEPIANLLARVHPDDRDRVRGVIEGARHGEPPPAISFRIQLPDHEVRFMDARTARRSGVGGRDLFVGWIQDVTETHRADIEIACHLAVAEVLRAWDDSESWMTSLLAALAGALDAYRASLWVPDRDGVLQPRWIWHLPGDETELSDEWQKAGRWLCTRAWVAREPVRLGNLGETARFPIPEDAARGYFSRGFAVPLTSGGEPLAVAGLRGADGLDLTARLNATLSGVGAEIGAFLASHTTILQPTRLTPREIEILRLASKGLTGPAIAAELCVSPATVKTHFENIYVKYDVPDRVAAVAKAIREGVVV